MKKFILLLFVFTGIVCHSKNGTLLNVTANDSIRIVKKVIKNYEKGVFQNEEVLIYSYENGLVSKIVTKTNDTIIIEDISIKYENGKLKEMLAIYPNAKYKKGDKTMTQLESIFNVVYSYDNDVIKNAIGYRNNKITQVNNFIYNTDKDVVKRQTLVDGILKSETKFKFNTEHNLLKEWGPDSTDHYNDYDDKKNPFDLVFPEAYLKIYHLSKNNVKSGSKNNYSEKYVYEFEYEYNSNNYPTKIIEKSGRKIKSETIIEYATNLN